jgi:hypothetical protein
MSKGEYSDVGALIQLMNWMTIPALGLQMVFAQQASAAVSDLHRAQLIGTTKAVMRWTFWICLCMVVAVLIFQRQFTADLELGSPASLWLSVAVAFAMLWLPIFQGLLQGRQNFLWLGWVFIFNGYRRVTHALKRDGWQVNHKRVLRVMREESLLCQLKRQFVPTTDSRHRSQVYPNLLATMELTALNQAWVGDVRRVGAYGIPIEDRRG